MNSKDQNTVQLSFKSTLKRVISYKFSYNGGRNVKTIKTQYLDSSSYYKVGWFTNYARVLIIF